MALTQYRIDRDGADRLLILLHGYSAEQHHLAAYVPLVDPDERFTAVAPRGPHDVPDGDGASWYVRGPSGADPQGFRSALTALDELIEGEAERAGIGLDRCVIGGFSQGGFLSLALAGRVGAPRYAGVWAMCCGLPASEAVPLDFATAAGTPVLYQYGRRDPVVSAERAGQTLAALRDGGLQVTEAGYDMAHSQCIEMMVDARSWLAGIA